MSFMYHTMFWEATRCLDFTNWKIGSFPPVEQWDGVVNQTTNWAKGWYIWRTRLSILSSEEFDWQDTKDKQYFQAPDSIWITSKIWGKETTLFCCLCLRLRTGWGGDGKLPKTRVYPIQTGIIFCCFRYKFSSNLALQENCYKMLHQWYLTLTRLSRMLLEVLDTWWWCGKGGADFLHIWWRCKVIQAFWHRIGLEIQEFNLFPVEWFSELETRKEL